jgi:hypothetical protein
VRCCLVRLPTAQLTAECGTLEARLTRRALFFLQTGQRAMLGRCDNLCRTHVSVRAFRAGSALACHSSQRGAARARPCHYPYRLVLPTRACEGLGKASRALRLQAHARRSISRVQMRLPWGADARPSRGPTRRPSRPRHFAPNLLLSRGAGAALRAREPPKLCFGYPCAASKLRSAAEHLRKVSGARARRSRAGLYQRSVTCHRHRGEQRHPLRLAGPSRTW